MILYHMHVIYKEALVLYFFSCVVPCCCQLAILSGVLSFEIDILDNEFLESLSTSEVCNELNLQGFDDDIVQRFRENKIDGRTLIDLNSEVIKLGNWKRLAKLRNQQL